MENEVKLFFVFDILGDTIRTGPTMWKVDRERLEDVKDHIFDLLLISRILDKHIPSSLNRDKIFDYILCHDLPEVITGDITKFEGVSEEEKQRVTRIAIDYLVSRFNEIIDLESIINSYEERSDIEAKYVHMIDKLHSASTFIKYETERHIDMDKEGIIPELRQLPFIIERYEQGYDVADIFFEFHMKAINISDEECQRYGISREDADHIVQAITTFANELYSQKKDHTLLDSESSFPKEALKYNRKYK